MSRFRIILGGHIAGERVLKDGIRRRNGAESVFETETADLDRWMDSKCVPGGRIDSEGRIDDTITFRMVDADGAVVMTRSLTIRQD